MPQGFLIHPESTPALRLHGFNILYHETHGTVKASSEYRRAEIAPAPVLIRERVDFRSCFGYNQDMDANETEERRG